MGGTSERCEDHQTQDLLVVMVENPVCEGTCERDLADRFPAAWGKRGGQDDERRLLLRQLLK